MGPPSGVSAYTLWDKLPPAGNLQACKPAQILWPLHSSPASSEKRGPFQEKGRDYIASWARHTGVYLKWHSRLAQQSPGDIYIMRLALRNFSWSKNSWLWYVVVVYPTPAISSNCIDMWYLTWAQLCRMLERRVSNQRQDLTICLMALSSLSLIYWTPFSLMNVSIL